MYTSVRAAAVSSEGATLRPLYAQVRDLLLDRVRNGEWAPGESLPNEHVLSVDFRVSIGTIRRAVADLQTNGVLVRRQGRGTYVAGRGTTALQERFLALRAADGTRLAADFDLVSVSRRVTADRERIALSGGGEQGIVEVVQHVIAGERIVGIEASALPAALLPRLETQLRFGQHLYPVLADYGLLVTRVEDTVGVETAGPETAALLGCAAGMSLLMVVRRAIALDERPVELRTGYYLPSLVRYAAASPAH